MRHDLRVVYGGICLILERGCLGRLLGAHQDIRMLLLDHHESTFSLLRDEARHNFLSHVLCGVVQQFLKLHARETMNDVFLAPNGIRVLTLELVQFVFLLEHVFD